MQENQSLTTGFPEFKVQFPEHEQLKCPRCDSSNTKFCYYNNYNLSQPRHFCKNCRRYWTKGGTLRNIPVGGGCRKNSKRPPAVVTAFTSAPSKQQQQQQEEYVVQNPPALIVPSSGLGSEVTQNSTLKNESGPALGAVYAGPGSVGIGESFSSLLGLTSEGQFGSFINGSSQNTGLDVVQGSGSSSSNGLQIESEVNYWASINPPAGY